MPRPAFRAIAALVLFTAGSCAASVTRTAASAQPAAADPIEARLVASVQADGARARALLKETVDINSGTMNFDGVKKVGAIFERELKALGFKTEWIDGTPFHRAGHLVASYGRRGPKVLLIGHLDTVFAQDSPFQVMQLEGPDAGRGPGATDMKGGDVIIVSALRALRASGQLDRLQLRVVLAGDEEDRGEPMALANAAMLAAGDWAGIAMGFENASGVPGEAATARRGASSWHLEVSGKASHSSQIFQPEVGAGAVFETARILDGFRQALSAEPMLTFNPGVIVGGTDVALDHDSSRGTAFGKTNVVAQSVRVDGDIRAISPAQLAMARKRMEDIVAAHLPLTTATLVFDDGYPPMAPTPGNARLLALYDQASRDHGLGPVAALDPRRAGAADISFVADRVDMALDGLGLKGPGNHTVEEKADLATLDTQAMRAALTLYRLAKSAR